MWAALTGIFTGLTLVVKFIKNILLKFVTHGAVITFQFTITATTITFVLAFYAFIITSIVSAYNYGFEVVSYINNSSGSVSCLMGLLDLIGFLPALNQGYTIFFASLSTVFVFKLMGFTFWAMRMVANEVFKLGVLLGQALS